MKIAGQSALVTVAGSGLGEAVARELARHRAPGSPCSTSMPPAHGVSRQQSAVAIRFPRGLGKPEAFAGFACRIVCNGPLHGEVIHLDGAPRMAPR
jgi:hypothetical protein